MSDGGGRAPVTKEVTVAVAVAVAVKSAEGKGSQRAVRWAVDSLMRGMDRLVLVHVMPAIASIPTPSGGRINFQELDPNVVEMYIHDRRMQCEESFLIFKHQYRKVKIEIVLLEGDNPALALLRYISNSRTRKLVLGSSKYFARRPKDSEVQSIVLKHAPKTCDVYVISGNKLISNSTNSPRSRVESEHDSQICKQDSPSSTGSTNKCLLDAGHPNYPAQMSRSRSSSICSGESIQEIDYPISDYNQSSVTRNEHSQSDSQLGIASELQTMHLELLNTLSMYNRACEELVLAQSKVHLVSSECIREEERAQAAQIREEALRKNAAVAKEKYLETEKENEKAKELLANEINERHLVELKADNESLEKKKITDALFWADQRYRRYTRDDILMATDSFAENKMIGEGAYGKVYKASLDHTLVAIKVLHPHASDRKEEFLKEVEVLSQLRHPHIACLLGACPEVGGLVYEYMENGNLEDHLLDTKDKTTLPWPTRFRIAFEVACGLAFLHHSNLEPIVHRDLKPGNILLDKHYVSKIGDVGLAKIISDVAPDNLTEYRDSVVAGTFFYMDPEYQRTGTLRPKSDLYSFGVITLQLLAARYPNGLIVEFENAISSGSFSGVLDRSVADWPLPEAIELAQIAVRCCQLRCRDRPDLKTEVLPTLKKLSEFADSRISTLGKQGQPPMQYYCPILQEIMDNPHIAADGFTYEHDAIKMWVDKHDVSPVTKQKLPHQMLTPNHMLHSAIQEWKKRIWPGS